MSGAFKPQAGRAWPSPARSSRQRLFRTPARFTALPPAADTEAQLARDLAVLIESGLVVAIRDGTTLRFAVNTDNDGPSA